MAEQTEGLMWGARKFDGIVEWGRDLERQHAWLLHLGTLAVGQVERFYTGVDGDTYKSESDGSAIDTGVFTLSTGHALLAKPENFVQIGPEEAAIYVNTIERLRHALLDAIHEAGNVLKNRPNVPPDLPMALIVSAVRAQLRALEATAAAGEG